MSRVLVAALILLSVMSRVVSPVQVMQKDVPQAVDILSDILLNSKLSPDAIERERAVILVSSHAVRSGFVRRRVGRAVAHSKPLLPREQREEEEVSKSEEEVTFDRLHSMAYQGTPLDKLILGSRENISKISRDDLVDVRTRVASWANADLALSRCAQLVRCRFTGM